jgi:hypothetical protein
MKRLIPVVGVLICLVGLPAFAARKDKPAGREIAEKARAAKLDTENATTGEKGGRKVKFTPAVLGQLKNETELEDGQVVGLLETEAPGDESPLAPGNYNMFLAKVGDTWHVYAESGGKIVAEAMRVTVEKTDKPASMKPEFRAEGWCFCLRLNCAWEWPPRCWWTCCFCF